MKIFRPFVVLISVSFLFSQCADEERVEFRSQNELWLLNETGHPIKVLSFARSAHHDNIIAGVRYVQQTNGYRFYSSTVEGDFEDLCIPSWTSHESWQTNYWLDSLVVTMVTDTAEWPLQGQPLNCAPFDFQESSVSFYDARRALRLNTCYWVLKEEDFK